MKRLRSCNLEFSKNIWGGLLIFGGSKMAPPFFFMPIFHIFENYLRIKNAIC